MLRPSHSALGISKTFCHLVSVVSAAQSVGHGGSPEANAKGVRLLLPMDTDVWPDIRARPDAIAMEWSQ